MGGGEEEGRKGRKEGGKREDTLQARCKKKKKKKKKVWFYTRETLKNGMELKTGPAVIITHVILSLLFKGKK